MCYNKLRTTNGGTDDKEDVEEDYGAESNSLKTNTISTQHNLFEILLNQHCKGRAHMSLQNTITNKRGNL